MRAIVSKVIDYTTFGRGVMARIALISALVFACIAQSSVGAQTANHQSEHPSQSHIDTPSINSPFFVSGVNNDTQIIKPIVYHDAQSGDYFYVESDGRHVTRFTAEGKTVWHVNPFVDGHLPPYRVSKPVIISIDRCDSGRRKGQITVGFNSSQFGTLDEGTGAFTDCGRD